MDSGSVVRRRQLARQLRLLREQAGLTLEAAAPELDWSVSKLSRIENGQQAVDVHWVRSMLDLYGAGGQMWGELVAMARDTRRRGWWRAFGMGDNSYVGFEADACLVRELTLTCIPGLLQTPAYSRALFAASPVDRNEGEVEDAVEVRAIRQRRLTSEDYPLELVAVIDESVLHHKVGGPEVLGAQLRHVVEMADLPGVTVQVLPSAVCAHAVIASGLTMLSFPAELGEPDLAYIEHSLGSLNIVKVSEVARAKLLFDRLGAQALGPADSVALIREVAEQY